MFSTDCTEFQHWQALLLVESAARVKQRGAITRVVSGCERKAAYTQEPQMDVEKIRKDHEAMETFDKNRTFTFHLHFVPDLMDIGNGIEYKFAVKAHALKYWLVESNGGTMTDVCGGVGGCGRGGEGEVAVVNVDPDFMFLRPFGARELGMDTDATVGAEAVRGMRGRPVAQAYHLGSHWLEFNVTRMFGANSPITQLSEAEGEEGYTVGPPYAMHRDDWIRHLKEWTRLIPLVYEDYLTLPALKDDKTRHYGEMFAYCMAAAHLGLKHVRLKESMTGCMVHYTQHTVERALTAEQKGSIRCGVDPLPVVEGLPSFVHYCSRHEVQAADEATGRDRSYLMYKRMVPRDVVPSCGPHLLELPPPNTFNTEKEEPFMVCVMAEAINFVAKRYRAAACGSSRAVQGKYVYDVALIPGEGLRKVNDGPFEGEVVE